MKGLVLSSTLSAAAVCGGMTGNAAAQEISAPILHPAVKALSSNSLRSLVLSPVRTWRVGDPVHVRNDLEIEGQSRVSIKAGPPDPLVQERRGPVGPQPAIIQRVNGITSTGYLPPDISFAVGPDHIVEMVNTAIAIYDKHGGTLLAPVEISSLWAGLSGACSTVDDGDPIVRYDSLAHRWLISQFALTQKIQCIAISKGPNPVTDGWNKYAFTLPVGAAIADYPKISIWPDAYYMGTQRGFPDGGLDVWAFERDKMLAGAPARQFQVTVAKPSLFLMPSDVDGVAPPAGEPNIFARHVNGTLFGGQDRLELFEFHVDWAAANATFQKTTTLATASYTASLCGNDFNANCAEQPQTPVKLETAPTWLMWRLQYRNFGTYESLVANHTVSADGQNRAGIRWYEIRKPKGGAWAIQQQGTYSPDSDSRFTGSIAMDVVGDIALGYSVSGANTFPSIRAATRNSGDTNGALSASELRLVDGGGSQTDPSSRWGDYSSMELDPVEPCTFWYGHEYYPTTSAAGWETATTSFRMPACPGYVTSVPLIRQDFSDCPNSNVNGGNPALVGGSVNLTKKSDGNIRAVVNVAKGTPNTVYHFFLKCVHILGDVHTDGRGVGNASFEFPTTLVGSEFTFDMYPEGAPRGNKYQSVRAAFR